MPDNYYDADEPTLPMRPPRSAPDQAKHNQPQQGPGQQGKLVIGSFQDQPEQRRPYQYTPQQQPPVEPRYPQQRYPQQSPVGPHNAQHPPARPASAVNPNANNYPTANPNANYYPNANTYSYQQPGQVANAPYRPVQRGRQGRRGGRRVGCLVILLVVIIIGAFAIPTAQRVLAFGSAISTQSPLSTQTGYMGTSDRVNLLVMGYGGGSHAGAYLTDSMLVVSVLPQSHHTSLVSVPRDLWIQYPPNSGNYAKINTVYQDAAGAANENPSKGGAAATQKVSLVTGLTVNYWLTIDFTGFKQVIDSLGGVDVSVPDSFNACYPKNDDATVDPSWIKVQFNKGLQHMDGATAISYARAREPLEVCGKGTSENLAELTDFGRSARQQIIINAVLAKVKQMSTWPRLYATMDALQKSIHTNLSLADLSELALKMDLKDPKAAHIGLSNQNVLQDSQSNDGQAILMPQNNNWQGIIDYIKQHLYN